MIKEQGDAVKSKVTLRAVALRAGTSVQTVSTVLNDSKSNTVVSAETRTRILDIAKEMQYRRNPLARSLRRGFTNIIGFFSGFGTISQTNPFIAEVFGGIQIGCNDHNKDLLIHGSFRGNSVDDIYEELTNGKIDGLVLYSPIGNSLASRVREASVPIVAIADALPGIVSVVMDDIDGGRQAAEHLHSLGHRHILYRHPPGFTVSSSRRFEGLRLASERLGMVVTPLATLIDPMHGVSEVEAQLLTSTGVDRPTAAVAWCDSAAATLLEYLAANQISVPGQMAVVGFDGFNLPFAGGAQLTTVVAPWAQVGQKAVSLLVEMAANEDMERSEILFPMHLRRGNTT